MKYKFPDRPFLSIVNRGGQIVLQVRQATDIGYIECLTNGVCDLAYPESYTRRARVTEQGKIAGTLMTGETSQCVFIEYEDHQIK